MSIRTIAVTIRPNAAQATALERLQRQFNAACGYISAVAWREHEWHHIDLRTIVYRDVRERFGLLAQYACNAVRVVCASYKVDRDRLHAFRADGAVVLDARVYRLGATYASIATLDGRIAVPLAIGGKQRAQLVAASKIGEADLIRDEKGRWRLLVCAHYADPSVQAPTDVLGVDLGIVNIAADSDGTIYSGGELLGRRIRNRCLRRRLQAKRTLGARRLLAKRRRKEHHFARHTNHVVAKRIVAVAKGTHRALALEDLGGIRARSTVARPQRALVHSWAFDQLRQYIQYKAQMGGVLVVAVDPRNSSRTCPACGFVAQANRPNQATFHCQSCSFSGVADVVAATVLRERGRVVVSLPYCSEGCRCVEPPEQSPAL
jgi:IS605 OrfB family transposase